MGNRICLGRRITVEERFTRPHRLVRQPSNVDYKKLRKLILSQKLAPCFDGVEDCNSDLEECPICFFFYPSLNRSRCCTKGICTECFLQMNPSSTTRSAQCPFCKTQSYAVEFRGPRTQEEKGREQVEEQRVIEAKIRMQLEELQNEDRVTLANRNPSISDLRDLSNGEEQDLVYLDQSLVNGSIQDPSFPLNAWNERREECSLDLEEIMMVEAILLSIQDQSIQKSTTHKFSRSTVIDETHSEAQIPVSDEISIEIARPNLLQPIYGSDNNTNGRDEMVQDGEFGSSIDDPNLEQMEGGILESPSSSLMRNQCPQNGSLSHVDVESSNLSSDVSCGSPYRSDIGGN